ncbi:DUF6491 family protein [Niveispirillum sp.]|uniref:DUF6491 family protein n=1 Tax=Niveispirillum sp. TaxID=1917217 RepID=UPI003BAADFBB
MRRHRLWAIVALFCVGPVLAADDSATVEKPRETCIESRRINGWTSESDRVIIVKVGAKQRYRMELSPSASIFNVDSQPGLAFIPRSNGTLCAGFGYVAVEGQRIPILSITRLPDPPAKVAASKPSEK